MDVSQYKAFLLPSSRGLSSHLVKCHWKDPRVPLCLQLPLPGFESSVGPMSHLPHLSLDVPRTAQVAPDVYIKAIKLTHRTN